MKLAVNVRCMIVIYLAVLDIAIIAFSTLDFALFGRTVRFRDSV